MDILLLAIISFLLTIIAIELYVLIHKSEPAIARDDDDRRLPVPPAGQTINVNLGTQATGITDTGKQIIVSDPAQAAAEQARLEAEEKVRVEAEILAREEEDRIEAEKKARMSLKRQTPSGAYVATCPSCGMENSSYRTECFNCGKSL